MPAGAVVESVKATRAEPSVAAKAELRTNVMLIPLFGTNRVSDQFVLFSRRKASRNIIVKYQIILSL
jgi:hypothetical protein